MRETKKGDSFAVYFLSNITNSNELNGSNSVLSFMKISVHYRDKKDDDKDEKVLFISFKH